MQPARFKSCQNLSIVASVCFIFRNGDSADNLNDTVWTRVHSGDRKLGANRAYDSDISPDNRSILSEKCLKWVLFSSNSD